MQAFQAVAKWMPCIVLMLSQLDVIARPKEMRDRLLGCVWLQNSAISVNSFVVKFPIVFFIPVMFIIAVVL